ncbi:MAG: LamG domain-containing protein [Kofleriaceae bacterium]
MQRVVAALVLLTGCGFQISGGSAPSDAEVDADAMAPAEDADLPMDDARIDMPIDAPIERVTNGLVALYTFEETAGTTVEDRSGVGTPVDLTVGDANRVTRADGRLTITQATSIMSPDPATKIVNACRDADAVTLEAWIVPRVVDASTLTRIVTLSSSESSLAVTLLAANTHYEFRLDGPMTDTNGLPSLNTAGGTIVLDTLRHVVLVTAPGGARRIYLDGVQVANDTLGGDLAGWGTTGHRFAVGNEINGNRAWLGTFDLVAVYARALSLAEVQQNFAAGPR